MGAKNSYSRHETTNNVRRYDNKAAHNVGDIQLIYVYDMILQIGSVNGEYNFRKEKQIS
jgi:hypothetical protein